MSQFNADNTTSVIGIRDIDQRVAEALGWSEMRVVWTTHAWLTGMRPDGSRQTVPNYSTDTNEAVVAIEEYCKRKKLCCDISFVNPSWACGLITNAIEADQPVAMINRELALAVCKGIAAYEKLARESEGGER